MVAAVAIGPAAEQFVTARGCRRIEIDTGSRLHRGERQLIEMQCGQLAGHLIAVRIDGDMTQLGRSCDGELGRIIETLIEKCADAVELIHRHKCIPVSYRAPTPGPCMQVVTRQAARVGHQGGAGDIGSGHYAVGNLLWVECLAIEEQLRVEFARTPAVEYVANTLRGNACVLRGQTQEIHHRVQIRRRGDNRADVEVTVPQPVDSLANS